jgi:two-component system alkaline phosphatase synthesis response regulator PhoP
MRRFRILIVDDDKSIVKVLQGYLDQAGFEVLRAYDGETCMHMLRREKPDLLILDLMLPDRDGWDITRTIRADEKLSTTPIIMLTARVEDTDKIVGLEIGADDYITKPYNPREVVARVRAMLRRTQIGEKIPPRILQIEGLHLDIDQHELFVDDETVELTPTEFKLLHVLMENPGYTLTREELLEKSVGYAYEGMGRTLDTHIRNIRKKIEPDPNEPTYIQTIYGIGYRLARKKQTIQDHPQEGRP